MSEPSTKIGAATTHENRHLLTLETAHPWRVRRDDDGSVTRMYGAPRHDAHASEVTCVTRDAAGVLLRHEVSTFAHKRLKGTLAAACMNPSASELAVLIRFPDVPEGPQMRLQLLSLAKDGRGQPARKWLPMKAIIPYTREDLPARLCVGPHMDVPASDYAFVLLDNAVRIFSLGSGAQVRVLRPFAPHVAASLDCLAVSATGRFVAVGSSSALPEHKSAGMYVYDLEPPPRGAPSRAALIKARAGSDRFGAALPEQRVRESSFYLGTDRSGALNDHANVMDFMRRTTWAIVEIAISAVDVDEGEAGRGGGGGDDDDSDSDDDADERRAQAGGSSTEEEGND